MNVIVTSPKQQSPPGQGKSKSARRRRARKQANTTKSTVVVVPSPMNPSSRQRARQRGPKRISERERFERFLLAPDLVGPMRIPRLGSVSRTGLAEDQTLLTLTSGAIATVAGFQATSTFSGTVGATFSAATTSAALASVSSVTPGSQFPASTQVADINFTSACIVIYYTGVADLVSGTVLIGSCIPISATASYNSLVYYPGFCEFPLAEVVNKPLRISARKISEVANEFIPIASGSVDVEYPVVLISGVNTQTLNVRITRCFEYRSTTSAGSVVPYSKMGASTFSDLGAYQDAGAKISENAEAVISPVEPGWWGGEFATEARGAVGPLGAGLLAGALSHAVRGFGQRMFEHRRMNPGRDVELADFGEF